MAKTKKIEDAIQWFQRCEVILVNGMGSTGEDDAENVVSTPQVAATENQESLFYGPDVSPLVQKKGMWIIFIGEVLLESAKLTFHFRQSQAFDKNDRSIG